MFLPVHFSLCGCRVLSYQERTLQRKHHLSHPRLPAERFPPPSSVLPGSAGVGESGELGLGSSCYRHDHSCEIILSACCGLLGYFVSSAVSFVGQKFTIPVGKLKKGVHLEVQWWDSAFPRKRLVLASLSYLQAGRVQSGPAERVGTQHRNLHHLSLSGAWASGKLHVFVLD